MIAAVLLAAAAVASPVEAERAFAAAAVRDGQWTAFRAFAAPDAVMFDPQPVAVAALLNGVANPAKPILWSPTASFVSCDGSLAANTGEWRRPDGSVGYFSTIWVRQRDGGWKWTVDGGDALQVARAPVTEPVVRAASCEHKPRGIVGAKANGARSGQGSARDATLFWSWMVRPDGARHFDVLLWSGDHYDHVIADRIAAPAG